jgi:dTDP-4-dehydrorhamnose reductase|tara:strand:- start:554 stop:1408 length:855 start_codon:yes stop_codon:yes gene_type:complete
MKKRVLICGNGYVGGYVFAQLSKNTSLEVALESKATLDYTDEYYLRDYIKEQNFDYLINAQGYTGRPNVDAAERDKEACWKYNVQVPVMFNTVCRDLHVQPIHITSGCIFTGYEKAWSEADEPNFGVFNPDASFYSTSKHAFESVSDNGITIRIRMPFCDTLNERSYLTKIHKYDNLISAVNSKTYIPELVDFIEQIIEDEHKGHDVVHFTNPEPLETAGAVELMREYGLENENWSWVDLKDLNLAAGRSNCILDTTKLKEEYGFTMLTETEALRKALKAIALD